ncbi:MAG: (d)CMP kinase [Deltaproteobacteria bacterium]|nr:(d)CMP kinase [Deltaproteobacteria bacterium]
MKGRRPVVTIDGPAGAGKSTVSRALAERLGFTYLDTGALYRTVALAASRDGDLSPLVDRSEDPGGLPAEVRGALGRLAASLPIRLEDGGRRVLLGAEDVSREIRRPEMSERASRVSAIAEVRAGLLDLQRRLGAAGGVVIEGRDVGTIVFPAAEVKFYLTADAACRARRRTLELRERGFEADEEATRRDIEARDARDSGRTVAPLRRPEGAVEIDSGPLSAEEVVERMTAVVRSRESS